jgi:tetratricopeptide (TPR) repeat protein
MSDSIQVTQLLQQGIAAAKSGRTQEARKTLLWVIELDERNETAWLWLSQVAESPEERCICLENTLAINPDNDYAQAGLRWLDQQASMASAAPERCPRCHSLVPPHGAACTDCGQVLIVACPNCGQYVDVKNSSCPECGQFLGYFRNGAQYHLALARAYLEQQQHRLAREAAARAQTEAPDDPQVLEDVAALYERTDHVELAIAVYERIIELAPESAAPYARLGAIYRQRNMPAKARAMYEQAAKWGSNDPAILVELAQFEVEENRTTRKTLKLLRKAIRLEPEHAQAHLLLGDVCLDQGLGAQAIRHYERAQELGPSDSPVTQEAGRKLTQLQPHLPERQTQGWVETLRRVGGLVLVPALAALVNARLIPWEISLEAWTMLVTASAGAFLWVCATHVPRNPLMRAMFGPAGVKGLVRQILVGIPGVLLWAAALGLILWKI